MYLRLSLSLTLVIIGALCLPVDAQKTPPAKALSFNSITLNKVGTLELNFKTANALKSMRNGVDISIKGKTPEEDLSILADTIVFHYASKEDTQPSSLTLTGHIQIQNSAFLIHAEQATINTATQEATFTKVTRIEHPNFAPMKADTIQVNLETGALEGTQLESIVTEETP